MQGICLLHTFLDSHFDPHKQDNYCYKYSIAIEFEKLSEPVIFILTG